ncbi:MAG: hypothetical protein WCL50_14105 [Spirochaetota bacterium]
MAKRSTMALPFLMGLLLFINPALWAKDASWNTYQEGRGLFEEKKLGEALNAWKRAIDERRTYFRKASAGIEAALATSEGRRAKDSITSLLDFFGRGTIGEREAAAIKAESGSSLRKEAQLYKAKLPDQTFSGFLDGLLAVVELRGADYLHDSLAKLLMTSRDLEGYPEAEFWIGRIFLAEGERNLAEIQFVKALAKSAALEIPEERFAILEELASVYRFAEKWKDYEDTLASILAASTLFSEKNAFLRQAMERALVAQGFDALVRLYRIDEGRILAPAAEYGEYLLRRGRSQADLYLAIAGNGYVSRIIDRVKEAEPSFVFTNLSDLFPRIQRDAQLKAWTEEVGVWKILYYLGEALLDQSERFAGRALLEELAQSPAIGPWARASRLALARRADSTFILP